MLSSQEITQYQQAVQAARQAPEIRETAEKLHRQYRGQQVKRLVEEKNLDPDEAEKLIPVRSLGDMGKSTQTLNLNESVEIDGRMMLVSELVENGQKYHGLAMPDPVEGSDYGHSTAKYYHNDGKNPCIHSFAHGVKTVYWIQLVKQSVATVETDIVPIIEPLDASRFPHKKPKKDGTHKPKCTIENVEYLLDAYGITVQYDVISKETLIHIPGVSGITENSANTAVEYINSLASLNDMSIGQVPRYVSVIADRNPVNSVVNWISSKPWDGEDRLQPLCDTLVTREDFPGDFKMVLVRKWGISAVAAATLSSGFHARGILTFQGSQGIGKTSWFRSLVPEGLLRDKVILTGHHLDPSNKDSLTTAIKYWITELGEVDSSMKKEFARLKGTITQDKDTVRRPYARTNSEYPRRTVFCASVNEDNFLIDSTGNSRFWVIPVVEIDYQHNIDMQQVFAQLYDELKQVATWWLTPDEDRLLDELNQAHKSVSVIEERVLSILNDDLATEKGKYMSASEVLQVAGFRSPTNPQARECGGVLRAKFGQPKKINGIMKWRVPVDYDAVKVD